jgi:predicted Zn finger-like uncharacterized protein
MPLVIHCPNCASRYEVADATAGKRVRCQKCQNVFTAEAATPAPLAPLTASSPLDPFGGVNLAQFPALPQAAAPRFAASPSKTAWSSPGSSGGMAGPPEGPSDTQMRLLCAGMLVLGLVLAVGSAVLHANTGTVYLAAIAFIPITLVLGIAGLISPDVIRACGKYGGHLPWPYKVAGWGLIGLSLVLVAAIAFGMLAAGFQLDRPGAGNHGPGGGRPGLDRAQTATVLDRIGKSYAASPDAEVVRTVSFPVFSLNNPGLNPAGQAEQVLSPVPGYVPGSFQFAADSKQITFQFKGDKAMAIQYALLLPGPTGIFMTFEPVFRE